MTSATAGNLVVHGFGPWGNARNTASPLADGQRGFTGHEHLAELGLIHMNGRIYDPVIGRFLQADPIIQAPQNAQSHNRYSYVLNNPLSFTDPSGFSWWTKWRKPIIALAVAWAIGPMGFWSMQGGLAGALMGNVAVGVSSASVLGTANFLSSVMAGFAAGGINGGNIQSALRGALTAGILQGFSEAIGGLGSSGEAPSPGMHMGASTADGGGGYVQSPVEGMPVGVTSDAVGASVGDPNLQSRYRFYTVEITGSSDRAVPLGDYSRETGIGGFIARHMLNPAMGVPMGGIAATLASGGARAVGTSAARAAAGTATTRVGRWMSEAEMKAMQNTGRVLESKNLGVTSVTSPPSASTWLRQTEGTLFVEFDVPTAAIRATDGITAKIFGPSSVLGRAGLITEMPTASNIVQTASKIPRP